ncbi:potassium transporter TrkA [Candidatus Bathyarchaeota archaeon]|nr:MAG: potassium transporter TrkA [Candidatus Bathyarchaeota archaeon]
MKNIETRLQQKLIDHEFVVIGCGGLGFSVVKELARRKRKVLAIDISKEKVELLRDENYDAIIGNAADEKTYKNFDFTKVLAVFLLIPDNEVNKSAIKIIRKLNKNIIIISRCSNLKDKNEMEKIGADFVLSPVDSMKESLFSVFGKLEMLRKLKKLKESIERTKGKLCIFTHDNPDPDAISSALALKEIAKHYGVESDIVYYGEIFHQENRAMVNLLGLELLRGEEVNLNNYSKFALVDSSAPGVNNSIPSNIKIDIVFDHHATTKRVEAEFVDIRADVGATATLLTEYLKELKISPSKTLATALFFGIKTETNSFKKNAKTSDFSAAAYLYPFVDHEMIEKIEGPAISTETLDVLGSAIKNREIFSSFLISFAGFINDRDALPQAADFLLRLEGISTVLVFGVLRDKVYLSARNKDVRINIGEILRRAFGDVGSVGGHAHSAGGQIPLGIFESAADKNILGRLITEAIKKRFLAALGIEIES